MNESTNRPNTPVPAMPPVPTSPVGQTPAFVYGTTLPVPSKPRPVYTATEGVFGLLFCLLGWLFVRCVLTVAPGVGATAYILLLVALSAAFLTRTGCRLQKTHWLWAGVIALFSMSFTLQSSAVLSPLGLLFTGGLVLLWGQAAGTGHGVFRPFLLTDLLRAVCVLPFTSFGTCFGAGLALFRSRKQSKLGYGLLGLAAALIPTAIVGTLLSSADVAFQELLSLLFTDLFATVGTFLWQFALGLPLACCLFGLLYGSAHGKGDETFSDETVRTVSRRMRKLPPVAWYTALTPLLLLYGLFFISQFAYFTDAFHQLLPEGYSYATYAREGFFQLCAVAVINLLILLFLRLTVRRPADTAPLPLTARLYGTVLAVFTLLLVATALRKMILYMEQFGLTRLRVYTTAFMLLIAAVFLLLLVALWHPRLSAARGGAAVATVLTALLLFAGVDAGIARYNTEQYQKGAVSHVDLRALYQLGDAAVPCLTELATDEDAAVAEEAQMYVEELARHRDRRSPLSFNLTAYQADRALSLYDQSHPPMSGTEFMRRCEAYSFWEYCGCEDCYETYRDYFETYE